ncbi:hypothetical protein D3C85_1555180 [compost metagenome]
MRGIESDRRFNVTMNTSTPPIDENVCFKRIPLSLKLLNTKSFLETLNTARFGTIRIDMHIVP